MAYTSNRQKLSDSMQKAVLEGRHQAPYTANSGYKCYIRVNDKEYFLRSSYEFIYAYYLANKKELFEVESIRVKAVPNPYRKVFISDFYIPKYNKIIEVKGWETEKDIYERQSFENAGFIFDLINSEKINIILNELLISSDIQKFLDELKLN